METVYMSINRWMDKDVVYIYIIEYYTALFLYTNNEKTEREIKETIPFTFV